MERLLTPEEVAELLGIPKATLAQWRYRGVGPPSCRVGRHVRYPPEGYEAWISDQISGAA